MPSQKSGILRQTCGSKNLKPLENITLLPHFSQKIPYARQNFEIPGRFFFSRNSLSYSWHPIDNGQG